jgi:hypothetical protein
LLRPSTNVGGQPPPRRPASANRLRFLGRPELGLGALQTPGGRLDVAEPDRRVELGLGLTHGFGQVAAGLHSRSEIPSSE